MATKKLLPVPPDTCEIEVETARHPDPIPYPWDRAGRFVAKAQAQTSGPYPAGESSVFVVDCQALGGGLGKLSLAQALKSKPKAVTAAKAEHQTLLQALKDDGWALRSGPRLPNWWATKLTRPAAIEPPNQPIR